MATRNNTTAPFVQPANATAILAVANAAPTPALPAIGKVKYAPAATLNNLNAVIASVAANPKSGKSAVRYSRFYQAGITVGQFIQSYKAAGLPSTLARADLRWDLQRGFITLA